MAEIHGKLHVLVIPFPAQSHINPMLEFAKCLASNTQLQTTLITTTTLGRKYKPNIPRDFPINIVSISDGSEDIQEKETVSSFFKRFETVVSKNLREFIQEQKGSLYPVRVLVHDSVFPWALEIVHENGLIGASFFTQSCSVSAIYNHIKEGSLKFPYNPDFVSLPCIPIPLGIGDLPSFSEVMESDQATLKLLVDQFLNLEKADWVLFNSFDMLENEGVEWMAKGLPLKAIGPTNILHQKDKTVSKTRNHMLCLFEPNSEACSKWLDSREYSSVVYVSFGGFNTLNEEQMEELAQGLILSKCHFLWVVRASEEHKLPQNFTSATSEKGFVVNWCSQTEVLSHRAINCFVTHCGWNSTLEALSLGVPLIAMAHRFDQTTNAKFVEDVWRVGVRLRAQENGIITREEIALCIQDVVHGEKGKELRRNSGMWMDLAKEAVENGGTTANNIDDFMSAILST